MTELTKEQIALTTEELLELARKMHPDRQWVEDSVAPYYWSTK